MFSARLMPAAAVTFVVTLLSVAAPPSLAQDKAPPATASSPPPTVPANPAPPPAAPGTPTPSPTPSATTTTTPAPTSPATAAPPTRPPATTPGSSPSSPATSPGSSPSTPAASPGSPASTSATSPAPTAPSQDTQPPNRITGIETNRELIAAEAPTQIVVNGTPNAKCGIAIDYGDGTRAAHAVNESSPFPLRLTHTYPKPADPSVRVTGTATAGLPACDGAADVTIHVSPAGSKIEYVTLAINACPEGWSLVGQVAADKSFRCTPVPDASAPTNLIHCTEGMKYFARGGFIGCAHPVSASTATIATAAPPPAATKATKAANASKPTKPKSKSAASKKPAADSTPAKP